ncbi:MAG: hypothetical protein AAF483_10320 [Planctomycetota bacterium]
MPATRHSPVCDINPDPAGTGLSLSVSYADNSLDLGLALAVAEYFRMEQAKATSIMDQVKRAVRQWSDFANQLGLQDAMAAAFRAAEE